MRYGHHPDEIDDYPWEDVVRFLQVVPVLHEREALGGLIDGN